MGHGCLADLQQVSCCFAVGGFQVDVGPAVSVNLNLDLDLLYSDLQFSVIGITMYGEVAGMHVSVLTPDIFTGTVLQLPTLSRFLPDCHLFLHPK